MELISARGMQSVCRYCTHSGKRLVSASGLRTLVLEDLQGKNKEPQVEKEPEKPLMQGLKQQEVGETPVTSCLKSMEREGKAES